MTVAARRAGVTPYEFFKRLGVTFGFGAPGDDSAYMRAETDAGRVLGQVMYKNSRNLEDFFDYAVSEPQHTKKSFVTETTPGGVTLDIQEDTVRHDYSERHRINAEDWRSVIDNIDTPERYALDLMNSDETYPVLLKVSAEEQKYGVTVSLSQTGRNIINTVYEYQVVSFLVINSLQYPCKSCSAL
jgi:hypothetical protein